MNQFVDQAKVHVKAGDGGNGCMSFRREKFVPQGGPDGGNGGSGGDIIFIADSNMSTLLDFKYKHHLMARRGTHGQGSKKAGAKGKSLYVKVPVGTIIYEQHSHDKICDMDTSDMQIVIAEGGSGGRGNAVFKSSRNRAPTRFEEGKEGAEKELLLELKLVADGGLVGFPNAGKSTLINRISNAKSKVAPYRFTTLNPMLGVMKLNALDEIVIADCPGLIEGAHQNVGLGHQFLRHVERTKFLLFVIDMSALEGNKPWDCYKILLDELKNHNKSLLDKKRLLIGNKCDLIESKKNCEKFKSIYPDERFVEISALTGEGIDQLIVGLREIFKEVQNYDNNLSE